MIEEAFRDHVIPLARREAGSGLEPHDLESAGFLALTKVANKHTDPATFWAYARPFVLAAMRTERRRMGISRFVPLDEAHLTAPNASEDRARLLEQLEHLEPIKRSLLLEHYVEELPLTQLADRHSMPLPTIKGLLFHALAEAIQKASRP